MLLLRKYKELILGLIMLAVAAVYLIAATQIQIRILTTFNSRFVPYILGSMVLVLGLVQSVRALRELHKNKREETAENTTDVQSVLLTFALIVVYVITLRPIGFLINTIWMMVLMMMLLSPRKEWKPVQFVIISVITSVIIYYVFRSGLDLMLPGGILG